VDENSCLKTVRFLFKDILEIQDVKHFSKIVETVFDFLVFEGAWTAHYQNLDKEEFSNRSSCASPSRIF
jgi:hypothetical protein